VVEPADWLSGDHRIDGVLAAAGPGVDPGAFGGSSFNLVDLAPTILAAAGATPSVRHSGRVLEELVGSEIAAAAVGAPMGSGAASPGPADREMATPGLDGAEADEVEEHLRGLGYLE